MKALIQRVRQASVTVAGEQVSQISAGMLVFLGVEKTDSSLDADKLIKRLLAYRIFADDSGKMNRSVIDIEGELLIVSQFTLVADTSSGLRPSFSAAADKQLGATLYQYFLDTMTHQYEKVKAGVYAADMQVELCNDGPVTFLL